VHIPISTEAPESFEFLAKFADAPVKMKAKYFRADRPLKPKETYPARRDAVHQKIENAMAGRK
jgi:hypothetical protein